MNDVSKRADWGAFADDQPFCHEIWRDKYRFQPHDGASRETTPLDTIERVVRGVYVNDTEENRVAAYREITARRFIPGGRIMAGAGTPKQVTWINCFVMDTIKDDLADIFRVLTESALTMQQGGGIGIDISTLRPKGALLERTHSFASGPLSFADVWDAMCQTIMSAGARRGAMMLTMRCDHPNIEDFIEAKQKAGRLTQFNVSVLVTQEFMDAVRGDLEWDLVFAGKPPVDASHVEYFANADGECVYVYKRIRARELWDKILRATYEYAEPGVIFIDRINEQNNLGYCETISCTNPCGEEPLPAYGDCNLGAINLAQFVRDPWTDHAKVDTAAIARTAVIAMRFLDNVIDATSYPLPEQEREAKVKRRTGLGIMGLTTMLQQRGVRYGSDEALRITEEVMCAIRDAAYRASVKLAIERGSFPLLHEPSHVDRPFLRLMPDNIRESIEKHGIRNGVLLTVAPTGTTAIFAGNVSSGIEPVFAHRYTRRVLQDDGSHREEQVYDWGWLAYCRHHDIVPESHPAIEHRDFMVSAADLTVEDHVRMQAAAQKYIDASISKTINCPADMSFEAFKAVYDMAYDYGCKGCTTYRPSEVRGAVLTTDAPDEAPPEPVEADALPSRPRVLPGATYKLKPAEHAYYITITDNEGRPFELFINSKDASAQEWTQAFGRMVSAILRRGGDVGFVSDELQQVHSAHGGFWEEGRYVPSLPAGIGAVLQQHMEDRGLAIALGDRPATGDINGARCPTCQQHALVHADGCQTCLNCGWSNCG